MLKFSIVTDSRVCYKDVTKEINQLIKSSGIDSGVCFIFIPHTTAAVTVNERADPSVMRDVAAALNKLIPMDDNYHHLEGNSAAHIKSSLVGAFQVLPVENGQLVLGTWQAVFFCEFDGPRNRNILLKILPDKS